jgi:hypothetical protein
MKTYLGLDRFNGEQCRNRRRTELDAHEKVTGNAARRAEALWPGVTDPPISIEGFTPG